MTSENLEMQSQTTGLHAVASTAWLGRILELTLTRKWFELIASGAKSEEYRTPSKWIMSRLEGKDYDTVRFRNGYNRNAPVCVTEYNISSQAELLDSPNVLMSHREQ